MSYTYVTAVVRTSRTDPTWVTTDLSQTPLNTILSAYYQAVITLTNSFDLTNTYLTSAALATVAPPAMPSPTLTSWLASLGNASLPTTTTPPSTTTIPVGYSDAWQAGFVANLGSVNRSTTTTLTASGMDDVLLTKAGLDMSVMSDYMLTTVNGYLHPTVGSISGLYILGGGISNRICGDNHVGILSFLNIGKITQIPITASMIYKPSGLGNYSQHAYIQLPVSMAGKILLMSIGGYLHALDPVYQKVSDTVIKVNMNRIAFPERVYQSIKAIDLSSLPIETGTVAGSTQYVTASLKSDAVIQAYLTLPQTFAILVDAPSFYRNTIYLERSCVPGRYFNASAQRFPLMGPMGRIWDYRISQEEDEFVYGCDEMHNEHYDFQTTDWFNKLSIANNRYSARPWSNGKATLLEMGTYG